MTFDRKRFGEKEIIIEKYYKLLVRRRNKKRLQSVKDICSKYLNNVKGKAFDFEALIKASPQDLESIYNYLRFECPEGASGEEVYKAFVEYLYEGMSSDARNALVNGLGVTVCPYCNHNYVFIYDRANFCELDHYYPKAEYPLLAVSFYNLIPSCPVCNGKKGNSIWAFKPHDTSKSHRDIMNFELLPKDAGYFEGNADSFDLILKARADVYQDQIDKLHLEKLYNWHKQDAAQIVKMRARIDRHYIMELCREFPELFKNQIIAEEIIYGTTLDPDKFERVPLSKFKNDIYHIFDQLQGNNATKKWKELQMSHFKDLPIVKQNNKDAISESLRTIAAICQKAYKSGVENKDNNHLLKELFDKKPNRASEPDPKHLACEHDQEHADPTKETEKRICRCMFYYKSGSSKCDNCKLVRKWKNVGKITVIDYEKPMAFVTPGAGGIDLFLRDTDKTEYAVEVKRPEGNNESISRMFAEIMTYTWNTPYRPGIAVFKDSYQHRKLKQIIRENSEDYKIITEYIKVFIITIVEEKGDVAEYRIDLFEGKS